MGSENIQAGETGMMHDLSRRRFLRFAGGVAGAGVLLSSCRRTPPDTTYIGAGDVAMLNYLYIMETILAAFYTRSYSTGPQYYGLTVSELQLLADLRDHQLAHQGMLKTLLGASAIPPIVTNLSAITFANRTSTLNYTITFEDMAVGAYNGAAKRFTDTSYVQLMGKMATVQARHSAYARDILTANTFSDSNIVNSNGLDQALAPAAVMASLMPYIQTPLDIRSLPA